MSYASHEYCKVHTEAIILLEKGAVTIFSIKHKIQGKSSTEDNLVVIDDSFPHALWTKYFIKDQGVVGGKKYYESRQQ